MKTGKVKPRIALLAMGILGEDKLGQGIPVLTDLFKRLSHYFDIVFYSFGRTDAAAIPQSIKVRQVVSWPVPGRLKYFILCMSFLFDHLRSPHNLLFAVSVFPTGRWAVRLGKLVNRKVLVQIIALEAVALPDIKAGLLFRPWHRKITIRVCKKADVLIAVAEYQKKIAKLSLPTDRDIVVLPLRIDPHKFPYSERHITFPVQFIHVAYYSAIKDQDTMFRAFAKVGQEIDCHLTVIGSGYDVPAVPVLLKTLGIQDKVTFIGVVMQSDLPQYFRRAHILLHTARFETGCAVIQEAMASGVAVCGTEVGILSDIGEEYAAVSPPKEDGILAEKILALIGDREAYSSITKKAYAWITQYGAEWAFRNYLDFLNKMLKRVD